MLVGEIIWYDEHRLADGAVERERCVKYQCGLYGTRGILVCIRDGYRAHGLCESTSYTANHQWCHEE